ncbi:MAG: YigZ family protein [Clostridiales bacterium]|nr:YigZ family protein [Clostridiales bacterium]
MQVADEYYSVAAEAEADFVEKKSRFIGRVKPVTSEAAAKEFIESVRMMHREANHHVYAFVIGANGEIQRSSDDGEPAGTAGRPVLETLKQSGLQNVALVVTRYFGGILLGAGGLTRAYGRAAAKAIEQAKPVLYLPCEVSALHFGYDLIGRVEGILGAFGCQIRDKSYTDTVCYLAAIPLKRSVALNIALAEVSNGTVRRQGLDELVYIYEDR